MVLNVNHVKTRTFNKIEIENVSNERVEIKRIDMFDSLGGKHDEDTVLKELNGLDYPLFINPREEVVISYLSTLEFPASKAEIFYKIGDIEDFIRAKAH